MPEEATADSIAKTRCAIRLEWYEKEIQKRIRSLGAIFLELRNDADKPWRFQYKSYEDYCEEVWGLSPRRIRQLAAGEAVKALLSSEAPELSPVLEKMPEGQLRELATAPPEKRVEILREVASSPAKVTAKTIRLTKARIIDAATGEPESEPIKRCESCGQPMP